MRTFGVIGKKLSHSFSPEYFRQKFEKEGIVDAQYLPFEIDDVSKIHDLLREHPEIEGLNITFPYKEKVLSIADTKSAVVKRIGAANCLKIVDGKIHAYNTDAYGFRLSLVNWLLNKHMSALILGTGGASKAVAHVLQSLEMPFLFVSREANGTIEMNYPEINTAILSQYKLIINTTPLGTFPDIESSPAIPYQLMNDSHHLYDLVYNPEESTFLSKGRIRNCKTKNGLEMLEMQADASWQIWNTELKDIVSWQY